MAQLTTLFNGNVPTIKTEPQSNGAKKSHEDPAALLFGIIRVAKDMDFLNGFARFNFVGTERCANSLYNLHFGHVVEHIRAWDLKDDDVKKAAKWAISDLVKDEKYENIPPIIKKIGLTGSEVAEAIGLSLLKTDEMKSLYKKVEQALSKLHEEAPKTFTTTEWQEFLRKPENPSE